MLTGFRGGGAVAVSFNVRWRDESRVKRRVDDDDDDEACRGATRFCTRLKGKKGAFLAQNT